MINCQCANGSIVTTNDGRRTQRCTVCKQKWSADQPDTVFPNMLSGCCDNPRIMLSDDGNTEQECRTCHMTWTATAGYVNGNKSNDKPRSKSVPGGTPFVCYPVQSNCCAKPQIVTSRDGNRNQSCSNCDWSWSADYNQGTKGATAGSII